MSGWIKLHRKLSSDPLWTTEKFTRGQAWVDLLMLANHKYNFFYLRDHKIEVERGQVGYSQNKLAERWKWSRNKVRKFLKDLEKEQQVKQQPSRSCSIITILNYTNYQGNGQQLEQQAIQQVEQQEVHKQEYKKKEYKKKEERKEIYKEKFEIFRKKYPGTKRGLETEYDNFKKKHKNYKEIIDLLLPAIENQIEIHIQKIKMEVFCPEYKHLQTWINQKCWEEEIEQIEKPKSLEERMKDAEQFDR